MPNQYKHIGVDLAKSSFVADLPKGVTSFAQSPAGLLRFLSQLPARAWVVCEATGGYERALARACHQAGVRVSVVNPRRVREFAKSQGILAKTDRIDTGLPLLESLAAARRALLEQHIKQIDAEMERVIAADLLGVAPLPNQSGSADKPRHIAGGRHRLRKILYMAALSAARHNPLLSALYRRLREKGKPVKVALSALMRKLIELLNLLLKYPNFSCALITVAYSHNKKI